MSKSKLAFLVFLSVLVLGFPEANASYRIDTSMVDGLRVDSPTRVQAGKTFQVKLTSRRSKFKNGICWWSWYSTKGFADGRPPFQMKNGQATTKALPIDPGAGSMAFTCGTALNNPQLGGSVEIYIAP